LSEGALTGNNAESIGMTTSEYRLPGAKAPGGRALRPEAKRGMMQLSGMEAQWIFRSNTA